MHFRRSLMQAAEEAHAAGEISRSDLFRLRVVSLLPRVSSQIELAAAEQAHAQGVLPAGASPSNLAAIDWTSLLAFLKELLPILLQILAFL